LHRRKEWDPGERFRWELLERESLGMVPQAHFNAASSYSGVFSRFPDLVLREGDHDPNHFGGANRSPFSGSVIKELKQDLADIGYSITNVNGQYDAWLGGAVDRFLRHFFSASRGPRTGRNVDLPTATRIKDVAEEVRNREQEWSCWLVRLSRAIDAKFHTDPRHHHSFERGLIGVYTSEADANADGATQGQDAVGYPWLHSSGNWERWIVLNTRAKGFRFQGRNPRGLVGIYYSRGDAEMEVTDDNPWPSP
jgi:hypothetical protein